MAEIGIVDAWAQLPVRGDQLVPEVRRLLELSGTAEVLQTGVDVAETIAAMDRAGVEPLFMATYGSEKVLFGTNYPQLPLERCAAEAQALHLSDEAMQNFLRTNALHAFGVS